MRNSFFPLLHICILVLTAGAFLWHLHSSRWHYFFLLSCLPLSSFLIPAAAPHNPCTNDRHCFLITKVSHALIECMAGELKERTNEWAKREWEGERKSGSCGLFSRTFSGIRKLCSLFYFPYLMYENA